MSSPTITIALNPVLDTLTAASADRSSRHWLEQAGFVRDDATGLHRLRRDTSAPVGRRISADATRLLTASGYSVLRLYSEEEQHQAVVPDREAGPVLTREPGTIWRHHVASDIAAGHLVVHACLSEAAGPTSFLASYTDGADAAVLATEGTGFFGVTRYPDLGSAKAAFGWPPAPNLPSAPSRRAAASSRTASTGPATAAVAVDRPDRSPATAGSSRAR